VDQQTDVLVVGGGRVGVGAALAALELGCRVVLTEESAWLGGRLTSQAVPPDEHPWIAEQGATRTYRGLREQIRSYYVRNYPLTENAARDPLLNPGGRDRGAAGPVPTRRLAGGADPAPTGVRRDRPVTRSPR